MQRDTREPYASPLFFSPRGREIMSYLGDQKEALPLTPAAQRQVHAGTIKIARLLIGRTFAKDNNDERNQGCAVRECGDCPPRQPFAHIVRGFFPCRDREHRRHHNLHIKCRREFSFLARAFNPQIRRFYLTSAANALQ